MKTITVHGKSINVGQIVNTIDGRARLDYVRKLNKYDIQFMHIEYPA